MLNDICVFDFETTGLDHVNDQVIEMAAIRVIDGKIVSSFNTLVQLEGGRELAPKITEITGLKAEDLTGGMAEQPAFVTLRKIMGPDSLLVAHNAAFDLQFLHHAMQRIGGITFKNPFIDTMTIARDRHTYPHRLDTMCERYGINLDGAHRALNDVIGCWELLKSMHDAEPVDKWLNKLGYLSKYGPPAWAPEHATLFGTVNRYDKAVI